MDEREPSREPSHEPSHEPSVGEMPELSAEEREQIEAERQQRLHPDNRPDNAEVDNTSRDFDVVHGRFTDSPAPEQGDPEYDPSAE
jgi:hypothetical protein